MQVQIYDVRVPDSTTRFFQVPAYDVPIIKRLWAGRLAPDFQGNQPQITVQPLGVVEFRQLHAEKIRIRRDYGVQPDGATRPAWQEIYATDPEFEAAYQREVKAAQRVLERQAKGQVATEEPEEEADAEPVGAAASSAGLFEPQRPPRRRSKA